jgi:hypothetical protein
MSHWHLPSTHDVTYNNQHAMRTRGNKKSSSNVFRAMASFTLQLAYPRNLLDGSPQSARAAQETTARLSAPNGFSLNLVHTATACVQSRQPTVSPKGNPPVLSCQNVSSSGTKPATLIPLPCNFVSSETNEFTTARCSTVVPTTWPYGDVTWKTTVSFLNQ